MLMTLMPMSRAIASISSRVIWAMRSRAFRDNPVMISPDLDFDASLAIMRNWRLIEMMSFMSLFQNWTTIHGD
jgi:hypothetical protein